MTRARPSQQKRNKERARQERQKQKIERRQQAKAVRDSAAPNPTGEDPDIAGIRLGPQPLLEE